MKNVITIDGPSGSGKGTVSRKLAEKLGFKYLDTGALYRAVAWQVDSQGISPDDSNAMKHLLENINITFEGSGILVNNTDVSAQIRTAHIGELSSQVSALPQVRQRLFSIQRDMGLAGNVVIEGRDTGTAIFPEALNKFYLDAAPEERAKRRFRELKDKHPGMTLEQTLADINKRDERDSTRERSPLRRTEDMIYIDSTGMTIDEVVSGMIKHISSRLPNIA